MREEAAATPPEKFSLVKRIRNWLRPNRQDEPRHIRVTRDQRESYDQPKTPQSPQNFESPSQLSETITHETSDSRFWEGFAGKDHQQLRAQLIETIGNIEGFDPSQIHQWCDNALTLSRELYQNAAGHSKDEGNGFTQTRYHGAAETRNGQSGHIEQVMTSSLLTFASLKQAAPKEYPEDSPIRAYLIDAFGPDYQQQISDLGPVDLKRLIGYAAFHEAGEWWPRMIPLTPESLDNFNQYKSEVDQATQDFFEQDQDNGVTTTQWRYKTRLVNGNDDQATVSTHVDQVQDVQDLTTIRPLIEQRTAKQNLHQELAFNVKFPNIPSHFLNFMQPISTEQVPPDQQKGLTLARIARAADLLQSFDQAYFQEITVNGNHKTKGPAFLFLEMRRFMPHALENIGWKNGIASSNIGTFFLEEIVLKLNAPEGLLEILDQEQLVDDQGYFINTLQTLRERAEW